MKLILLYMNQNSGVSTGIYQCSSIFKRSFLKKYFKLFSDRLWPSSGGSEIPPGTSNLSSAKTCTKEWNSPFQQPDIKSIWVSCQNIQIYIEYDPGLPESLFEIHDIGRKLSRISRLSVSLDFLIFIIRKQYT